MGKRKAPAGVGQAETGGPAQLAAEERSQSTSTTAEDADRHQRIAARAYALFVARGGRHGDDLADWFQAEQELREGGDTAACGRAAACLRCPGRRRRRGRSHGRGGTGERRGPSMATAAMVAVLSLPTLFRGPARESPR